MTQWKCPLCGKTECMSEPNSAMISFDCKTYKRALKVSQEILNLHDVKQQKRLLNLIFEHSLYNKREQGKELCYYYDEVNRYSNTDTSRVNVAELLYPRSFSDKVNRILTNVSHIHEINRSKFVVFDLTTPNYGAYYEAGYALGRGKVVIS